MRVGWRLVAGLVALVVTVMLTLPAAAARVDLGSRISEIWPNVPLTEIWPNAPVDDFVGPNGALVDGLSGGR